MERGVLTGESGLQEITRGSKLSNYPVCTQAMGVKGAWYSTEPCTTEAGRADFGN